MKLTDALERELKELGLHLDEEEDIVYLMHQEEVIEEFFDSPVTILDVRQAIGRFREELT